MASRSLMILTSLQLALTGCLSLDQVTMRDGERNGEKDGGPMTRTAKDGGPEDGAAPEASVPPSKCVDRGDYALDDIPVQGSSEACGPHEICVEGFCEQEPACAKDATTPCVFTITPTHGPQSGFVALGSYVYWTEGGTYDALKNYQNDGALLRAKVGAWQPEEIVSGLDFYDDAKRRIRPSTPVAYASWLSIAQGGGIMIASADGKQSYTVMGSYQCCVAEDGTSFCNVNSEGSRVYNPLRDVDRSIAAAPTLNDCQIVGKSLWTAYGTLAHFDLETEQWDAYFTPIADLVAVRDQTVIQYGFDFVAVASLADGPSLKWKNVAGGTRLPFGKVVLRGDEVYWARGGTIKRGTAILRGSLSGTVQAEVVTELPEIAALNGDKASEDDFVTGELLGSDAGLLWHITGSRELHFIPLPAPQSP